LIVCLGIGSNIEPRSNIKSVVFLLRRAFEDICFSRVFETESIGFDGDDFLNLVAKFSTSKSVGQIIEITKGMEKQLGRMTKRDRHSSRLIDIDILLYGDTKMENPISLPRGDILKYAYVLWPLSEVVPEMVEPGGCLTYAQLWADFDKGGPRINALNQDLF
jgi:2-amino-4-hydroxy-6-hydroxymethyldihydropteridine diphosphokinase